MAGMYTATCWYGMNFMKFLVMNISVPSFFIDSYFNVDIDKKKNNLM